MATKPRTPSEAFPAPDFQIDSRPTSTTFAISRVRKESLRESELERRFVDFVKANGGVACKWVSPGRRGVPDRVVFMPGGRIVLVELKTIKGSLSALQVRFHQQVRALGTEVLVIRRVEEFALVL